MNVLSISQAKAEGLTRYFTGKPCGKGHVSERMVSNKCCVTCLRAKRKVQRQANPEREAAVRRAWVASNPEHHKALKAAWNKADPEGQAKRSRAWYLRNKEQADTASKRWVEENRGRANARVVRYHAERLQRTPAWADIGLIDDIYSLASVLRVHGGVQVDVDHEVPLRGRKVSGLHTHHNLRLLDSTQNKSKSNHFNVS
jgi:hypothetical protein